MFQSVKLPLIIETDLFEDLTFDIPDSIIVINTNFDLQINKNNVYN